MNPGLQINNYKQPFLWNVKQRGFYAFRGFFIKVSILELNFYELKTRQKKSFAEILKKIIIFFQKNYFEKLFMNYLVANPHTAI